MQRLAACVATLLALSMHAPAAQAQLASCAAIADDRERLACYDAIARPESPSGRGSTRAGSAAIQAPTPPAASDLERRWELRPDLQRGTFNLLPYRPVYALVHGTSNINDQPSSPTRSSPLDDVQLDRVEAKLQLSFKTKLVQDLLGSPADLWLGYTQLSLWQAGNGRYSSPFRETDYAPEGILIHPLGMNLGDLHFRYVGASLTHESNGRGAVLSRSWNRVIGELAMESGAWSLHLRPWVRVFRSRGSREDNPDIPDFVGRGELMTVYRAGRQVVTLTGRHTLKGGERSRGSARLDWAFPLTGGLDGHLQLFTGYGETLIDYNHRQTSIGIGVSFFD